MIRTLQYVFSTQGRWTAELILKKEVLELVCTIDIASQLSCINDDNSHIMKLECGNVEQGESVVAVRQVNMIPTEINTDLGLISIKDLEIDVHLHKVVSVCMNKLQ